MPKSISSAPLTFDLPVSLIARMAKARRGHGLKTASEVVRLALEQLPVTPVRAGKTARRE